MIRVNVFDIKARLSEYLDRAAAGERILICRHNKPVAELRAVEEARTDPRPIGPLPGRPGFDVPASFFEALDDEELDLWDGVAGTSLPSRAPRSGSGASKVAESKRGDGRGHTRRTRRPS